MNIFVLDEHPVFAARMLCDKHVVKMVLETAQLLSTTYWHFNQPAPYKQTHKNHPCAVWARSRHSNYEWLWEHGIAIAEEYTYRYNKIHKSQAVIEELAELPRGIRRGPMTPFPLCMPDKYKTDDVVESYRAYYVGEKSHMLTYKNRPAPEFIQNIGGGERRSAFA